MEPGWAEWFVTNLNEALLSLRGLKEEIFFLIKFGVVLAGVLIPVSIVLRIFRQAVVVFFSGFRNIHVVEFSDREVVKNALPLRRMPLFGALIFIPQGVEGIVSTNKKLAPRTYEAGEHTLYYTTLHASVQYVDVRQRSTNFSIRRALTRDGFHISISGIVSWQVDDTLKVARIKDPVGEIINIVEVAVRDIISEYDHDQLILNSSPDNPNRPLINEQELIDVICEIIKATPLFQNFNLHTVVLVKRKGDRAKLPPPPPKPTEAEERAKERKTTLSSRQEMLPLEREIALHEIAVEREWAKARNEILEREIELELRRKADRLELEREKVRIQAQTQAIGPALKIFAQILTSPNSIRTARQLGLDCGKEDLAYLINCLCGNPDILTAEYKIDPKTPQSTKEKLTCLLADLWAVDNIIRFNLGESPNGGMGLVVYISSSKRTKMAMFVFDLSGNDPVISNIVLKSSKGEILIVDHLELYRNLALSDVIRRLELKYGSKKKRLEDTADWD